MIQRRIGAGGMGVVYEARDTERGGMVAIKTLQHLDARALYRFKAEFRTLADVAHHNLVRLGELFGGGDAWFFTMELIDGVDLLAWVRGASADDLVTGTTTVRRLRAGDPTPRVWAHEDTPLPDLTPVPGPPPTVDEARLRAAMRQLAEGLAALHAAQKVHRDIKPSNILVTPAGRVVLLDFGLATDADQVDRLDSGASVAGTAVYMAPEQARQLAVGPEADWYAVGAVLYEALTGHPPFAGSPLEVLVQKQQGEPPPPRSIAPETPADLDALCCELLRRDPRERPRPADILARLGAAVSDAPDTVLATGSAGHETTPFVGRDDELAALRAAFTEAEAGLPISMFVLGESGMGKSALVRRFLDQLERDRPDALVLAGRCYERESVPFKAFDDVVDALAGHLMKLPPEAVEALVPEDASPLARVFPVLRRVQTLARAPIVKIPDLQELRVRAFAALRRLLSRLAHARPVVMYVDDFQWADADSLALFSTVMHGLSAPPLLFIATARAAPAAVADGALPPGLTMIGDVPGDLRTLSVLGLPSDQARKLTTRLLGDASATTGEIAAIVDESAGHPLFIQELARHLTTDRATGPTEARLDDALWARIGRLEPAARRLLEVVAVAGEPRAQWVAAQAADLDHAAAARVVGILRVSSLVRTGRTRGGDSIECYHDRIREAVVARLDADTLRRHHEALGCALEATAGSAHDAQSLVRHLEAAGLLDRAADQAARAARLASDALAFEHAVAMYEVALRLGQHTEDTARALRIAMADALLDAGRGTDAAEVYLAAAEGADAATRLECRRKAAGWLLITGSLERGLATLEGVLAELGEKLPPTPKRALASFLWQRAWLRLRGTRFTPRDESQISPRDLVLIDIYHSVGVGLGLVDSIRGADFMARGLRLALRVGERRRIARGLSLDAGYLASQGPGPNARAVKRMARCAEIVADDPDPYLRGWAIGGAGLADYLAGRFARGADGLHAAEAPLRHDTQGNIWELNTVRIFHLLSLRHLGRWRELRQRFGELLRDAARRGDRFAETTITRSLNIGWLITDDPARARRELATAKWTPPEGGYHIQHWYELRARGELALYEGDPATGRALFEAADAGINASFLLRVQMIRTEWTWLRGRVLVACGDVDAAAPLAKKLAGEGVAYAVCWSRMLEAGIAARRGDADAARARLKEAATLARAHDLGMCLAAAQTGLGDADGEAAMIAEGVTRPDRIVAMLLPGLSAPRERGLNR